MGPRPPYMETVRNKLKLGHFERKNFYFFRWEDPQLRLHDPLTRSFPDPPTWGERMGSQCGQHPCKVCVPSPPWGPALKP